MAAERDPHGILDDTEYDSITEARYQHPDSSKEERGVCPECGSSWLRYRPGNTIADNPYTHGGTTYLCRNCGHEFEETEGGE